MNKLFIVSVALIVLFLNYGKPQCCFSPSKDEGYTLGSETPDGWEPPLYRIPLIADDPKVDNKNDKILAPFLKEIIG